MITDRVAVIGGGYAGFAAAVTLATAGCAVTVFESARTLGGRARRVEAYRITVDNGQHILLGAYAQTLALIHTVHGAVGPELVELPRAVVHAPDPSAHGNEVAAELGVSTTRVRQLIATKQLPAKKVGRDWIVGRKTVARFKSLPPGRRGRPRGLPPRRPPAARHGA